MKNNSAKQKLVFLVGHDAILRNFIHSGATENLCQDFDVTFVYSDLIKNSDNGKVIDFFKKQNKFFKKIDMYLWYLSYFKYFRKTGNFMEALSCSFKASRFPKRTRQLLMFFSLPVLYECTMSFLELFLLGHQRKISKVLSDINPEAVIVPGFAFDSFGIQVMRAAKRLKIRNIIPVAHWDYLSTKGIIRVTPDQLWVWGEQMRRIAVGFHKVPDAKVKNIGVPHYQIYFDSHNSNKGDTIQKPDRALTILFAGAGIPYDELTPLKAVDCQIGQALPGNTKIIYRPHPKQHPRQCESDFKPQQYKNVILDSQWMRGKASPSIYDAMNYYVELLKKVDGVITPFSTLMVEAALCGKPSLILAFSDDVHEWTFENRIKEEHIRDLLEFPWMIFCLKKGNLMDDCRRFFEICQDESIRKKIQDDIRFVIYSDQDTYRQRLCRYVGDYLTQQEDEGA